MKIEACVPPLWRSLENREACVDGQVDIRGGPTVCRFEAVNGRGNGTGGDGIRRDHQKESETHSQMKRVLLLSHAHANAACCTLCSCTLFDLHNLHNLHTLCTCTSSRSPIALLPPNTAADRSKQEPHFVTPVLPAPAFESPTAPRKVRPRNQSCKSGCLQSLHTIASPAPSLSPTTIPLPTLRGQTIALVLSSLTVSLPRPPLFPRFLPSFSSVPCT